MRLTKYGVELWPSRAKKVIGRPYSLLDIMKEWEELAGAFRAMDSENIKEEVSDCMFTTLMGVYFLTGLSFPIIGGMACYRKNLARQRKWIEIFQAGGLEFHQKYLVGGSNWQKPTKVDAALKLARREQKGGEG